MSHAMPWPASIGSVAARRSSVSVSGARFMPTQHWPREHVLFSGGRTARPWLLSPSAVRSQSPGHLAVHWDGAGGTEVPVMQWQVTGGSLLCLWWSGTSGTSHQGCGRVPRGCAGSASSGMQKSRPGITGPCRWVCATSMLPRPVPWSTRLGGSHCSWGQRVREVSSAGGHARWF